MARKQLVVTKRAYARLAADLDLKYHGVTQKQAETALKHLMILDTLCRVKGYRSPLVMIRKRSAADAKRVKNKNRKAKARSKR